MNLPRQAIEKRTNEIDKKKKENEAISQLKY